MAFHTKEVGKRVEAYELALFFFSMHVEYVVCQNGRIHINFRKIRSFLIDSTRCDLTRLNSTMSAHNTRVAFHVYDYTSNDLHQLIILPRAHRHNEFCLASGLRWRATFFSSGIVKYDDVSI